jgi:hypothetical protein
MAMHLMPAVTRILRQWRALFTLNCITDLNVNLLRPHIAGRPHTLSTNPITDAIYLKIHVFSQTSVIKVDTSHLKADSLEQNKILQPDNKKALRSDHQEFSFEVERASQMAFSSSEWNSNGQNTNSNEEKHRINVQTAKLYGLYGSELESIYKIKDYLRKSELKISVALDEECTEIIGEGKCHPFKKASFDVPKGNKKSL